VAGFEIDDHTHLFAVDGDLASLVANIALTPAFHDLEPSITLSPKARIGTTPSGVIVSADVWAVDGSRLIPQPHQKTWHWSSA
jgi:hypothetical protein